MTPSPLIYLSAVVVFGIAAQWLAWRLKLPAILLLLAVGFAFGQWLPVDKYIEPELLFPAVSLAVAVILFEGGLTLRFRELRSTGGSVWRLVTIGCLITGVLGALAARFLIFDAWPIAILAGAIFTVTGPTVVIPLLRAIRPSGRISKIAKWEGIVIDPIGAMLAVLVFEAIKSAGVGAAAATVAYELVEVLATGLIVGGGVAFLLIILFEQNWIPDFLDAPVLLASVLGVFAASYMITGQAESGLVTVTVMGIVLANQRRVEIEHLIKFKESLGVLLISVLFILLSGRISPTDISQLGANGFLFLVVLILLVRPLSVFAATLGTKINWKERTFLAWLAPRGIVAAAVASVFVLELEHVLDDPGQLGLSADYAELLKSDTQLLVPLTFLVIIATVATYGLTAGALALRLGLADQNPQGLLIAGAGPFARAAARAVRKEGFQVLLVDSNRENIRAARMDDLPCRHGNILSETLQDDLDLSGLGRFLALTPNDEVNSLAVIAMRNVFGRAGVFQLPVNKVRLTQEGREDAAPVEGRRLFDDGLTFSELNRRVVSEEGVIKKTMLTEEFDFAAFLRQHGASAIVLFILLAKSKSLSVKVAGETQPPQQGQKIISLVSSTPPEEQENLDEPLE
ncbi:cation:proton antiporter [Stratiformator vulcanicus]|uniref:K(+)/H(+) antiporter NhaP2 n=1 Tax=Stratiformator vulcanicus TaxID=2527980 RepID=A0A517R7D7_9PLAN|nr:sodium:proton antiporter [Stratiformator vulcanicus]QDT39807.1 K(+)/H(+) antiporter NhaP2 [Stratiformator vulcanicus]